MCGEWPVRQIVGGDRTSASAADLMLGPVVTPADLLHRQGDGAFAGYDAQATAALGAMARYVTEFLTADHPALGRAGAVCPYAAGAIQRGAIRLVASPLDRIDAGAVGGVMAHLRDVFVATAAHEPRRDTHHAMIAVFPYLPRRAGAALIEMVQKTLKPAFVERGLMIGQFHPDCAAPGLHNRNFRPFRAPAISLAIREVTLGDAPFMADDARCAAAFRRRFGADALPAERAQRRMARHG